MEQLAPGAVLLLGIHDGERFVLRHVRLLEPGLAFACAAVCDALVSVGILATGAAPWCTKIELMICLYPRCDHRCFFRPNFMYGTRQSGTMNSVGLLRQKLGATVVPSFVLLRRITWSI